MLKLNTLNNITLVYALRKNIFKVYTMDHLTFINIDQEQAKNILSRLLLLFFIFFTISIFGSNYICNTNKSPLTKKGECD